MTKKNPTSATNVKRKSMKDRTIGKKEFSVQFIKDILIMYPESLWNKVMKRFVDDEEEIEKISSELLQEKKDAVRKTS